MEYNIIFQDEKVISKDFSKIPKNYLENIFKQIEKLKGGLIWEIQVKKLNHYYLCDYRLRVSDYRILFNLDEINKEIIIFRVLHRSKLY